MTMIRFDNGFITDAFSKKCEPVQGVPFLYTGRKPAVGHRTETVVYGVNGSYCRLSGVVTTVGELPTFDEWITSQTIVRGAQCGECYSGPNTKLCYPDDYYCPYPECLGCTIRKGRKEVKVGEYMDGSLEILGSLQNQTLTTFAYLNFDYFHNQKLLPFKRGRIYKVEYCCDDSKDSIWCVSSIQDVTTTVAVEDLPQVFKEWEQGRKAAAVPPFDLEKTKRQEWIERVQEENERAMEKDGDY